MTPTWWLALSPQEKVLTLFAAAACAFFGACWILGMVQDHEACVEALKSEHVAAAITMALCK